MRQLAKLDEDLPPTVVQVPSMRVIDGVHRVHEVGERVQVRGGQG